MMEQLGKFFFLDVQFGPLGMRGIVTILPDNDATVPEEIGFTLEGGLHSEQRTPAA